MAVDKFIWTNLFKCPRWIAVSGY